MRSRSSSPNTPSSDSSPSSSDLPLAAPTEPPIPVDVSQKELDDERLFSAFIDSSVVFDTTSVGVGVQPASVQYERLSGVLSSARGYHVPPPTHVVRPSVLVPSPDDELEEPEPEQEAKTETNVVNPPKESCVNLPIRVRNVPLQGAKSRVETQLKVTIDLVWDPTRPAHFHHGSSSSSGYSNEAKENGGESTVGSWEWLALPSGSATKRRGRKEAKIAAAPSQTLTLHTMVHVASAPHTAAKACKKCLAREAKRAERKRRGPNDAPPAPVETTPSDLAAAAAGEDDKIVLYNCADVLEFRSGSVDLPVRLTCYCRHHSEKVGFCITFILRDHTGRTVGTGVTPPILITDDHKSTARKVQVQAQTQGLPTPAPSLRKGSKGGAMKDKVGGGSVKHRMKPYARSTGTSRASSIGLIVGGGVKEEVPGGLVNLGMTSMNGSHGSSGLGNGASSYGTPSTQGYTSPPPQSPTQFGGMFGRMDGIQSLLGDGMPAMLEGRTGLLGDGVPLQPGILVPQSDGARLSPDRTLLSPTRSAFLSPPRSPVHSRVHTRAHSPAPGQSVHTMGSGQPPSHAMTQGQSPAHTMMTSPTQTMLGSPAHTRLHSRVHSPVQTRIHSPVHTRPHSPSRGASTNGGLLSPVRGISLSHNHSPAHSPGHSRSHSRAGDIPGLSIGPEGVMMTGAGLDGLPSDMMMSSLLGDGLMGVGDNGLLGMDEAFMNAGFAASDSQMFDATFNPAGSDGVTVDPSDEDWGAVYRQLANVSSQPAMYVEHPPMAWGPSPSTTTWAPEAMDLHIPDPTPIPRVSRVIPHEGPIQGGIEVTLLGENFTRAYECKFGEHVATETTLWGGNTLVCLLPPAAQAGAVPVRIKGYEHLKRPGERDVLFTYKDDSVDRSIMELALRVVGQRMTGRQEEPCNIARRIVAVGEMQSDQNTLMTRLAQSVIESDAQQQDPNSSRQDELIQFLTLLDVPNVGSRAVSTSTAVSLQNETGHTLLHLCAVLGFHALATDLLQRGADPDVRDATGQTALHLAALRGHVACARVLLEGRADADIVNAYGLAPVDVARERGSVEMLALLERADEESTEEDGGVEEIGSASLALDDSAGADADESDLEDDTLADSREPRPRVITESEEDIVSSASDANSESDIFADRPSRPSLDSITDVRPPFLGDIPKAPSTWFHRTLYNLQPQKAWPLPQINLPDMPALPAWPVTIPWPQTPEKGTFDLAAFRGFLGAKQQQGQQPDSGVRTMYPPPPQPAEAAAQGMSQAQLRTRLARRLGYYPTEVTEREMRAYTHHSQKMRKLKKDRMLVLFWLPILLIVIAWGLYQSVPVAFHAMANSVRGLLPLANR